MAIRKSKSKTKSKESADVVPNISANVVNDNSSIQTVDVDANFGENSEDEEDLVRSFEREAEKEVHSEESIKKIDNSDKNNDRVIWMIIALFVVIGIVAYFFLTNVAPSQSDSYGVDLDGEKVVFDTNDPFFEPINDWSYNYNNFEVFYEEGLWKSIIYNPREKRDVLTSLHHGPVTLGNISRSPGLLRFLEYSTLFTRRDGDSAGAMYVQAPPDARGEMSVATLEVINNLRQGMNYDALPAFSNNNTGGRDDIPLKFCNSTKEPIIVLKHESPTQITYPQINCVIVQGEGAEIWRAENLLLYIFYGVVPDFAVPEAKDSVEG